MAVPRSQRGVAEVGFGTGGGSLLSDLTSSSNHRLDKKSTLLDPSRLSYSKSVPIDTFRILDFIVLGVSGNPGDSHDAEYF